jgi:hypothetical protein
MPTTPQQRPWYKKKRFLIPIGLVGVLLVGSGFSESSAPVTAPTQSVTPLTPQATTQEVTIPASIAEPVQSQTETTSGLSNDNHYTNVDGNEVHSPAYSNTIPAGASAQCRDGTYSFSQHRSGTCSHHGGVAEWL